MNRKLLFDQNLPRRIVSAVMDDFPGSRHVSGIGLASASDHEIWDYARTHGFCIISKDADFHQLSFLHGAPPKTVWLKLGNCSTRQIADCLALNKAGIGEFLGDPESALLVVSDHSEKT